MNFAGNSRNRSVASLEVTPLVDVVFLLLIFFLLTATYVKNPTIDIDLPRAAPQSSFTKDKDVSIAVRKDGAIQLGDKTVALDELEAQLRERRTQSGDDTVVIVRADEGALHGRVVTVMDLVKKAGFNHLAIAIRERKAAP